MINRTKKRLGFASYDFSNSGYVAVFQSFLFPLVLAAAIIESGSENQILWPTAVAVSSIIAIIAAPFVGRLGDHVGKPLIFSVLVVACGALATATTPLLGFGVAALVLAFIIFNSIFELSQSLYDSFLVDLSDSAEETTRISSFAWGFGYLGGAVFAALYFVLDRIEVEPEAMLPVFGLLFIICSIPAILFFFKISLRGQCSGTMPSLRRLLDVKSPVPWRELFIYWVIADTVAAILYFAPLYLQSELDLSITMVGAILLVGQLIAFPATILVGRLANRIGRVPAIRVGLLIWGTGLIGLFFAETTLHVVLVFFGLSLVVGSTQALLRAHFADRVEAIASGEGLGFFAVAQKSASVIAPLLVIAAMSIWDSIAPAFLALAVLILIAYVLAGALTNTTLKRVSVE